MENDDFYSRGERLKEERKRLGINTQDEFAALLGVKKNSIVRYEKHNSPLKQHHLTILKENGFDVDYILGGNNNILNDLNLSDDQIRLLSLFNDVPDEMKAGFMTIVEAYANQFHK